MKFTFAFYPFFFFPARVSALGEKSTVHTRFSIVHRLKNLENGTHSTIHTFKNYFATMFSVFSFNKNKLYQNGPKE